MGSARRVAVVAVAGTVAALVGPGCGDDERCGPNDQILAERPVAVDHRTSPSSAEDAAASFVFETYNAQESVERVRLAIDGRSALDIDLPAACADQGHVTSFSVAYDLPPGPVVVELDIQGSTSETTVDVPAEGTIWGVVGVQSRREWGDVQVHHEEPQWG